MLDRKSELRWKSLSLSLSLSLSRKTLSVFHQVQPREFSNEAFALRDLSVPAADIIPSRGEPKFPRSSGRNPAAEFPSAAKNASSTRHVSELGYRLPKMFTSETALHPRLRSRSRSGRRNVAADSRSSITKHAACLNPESLGRRGATGGSQN
jgi:hypothetical protein